MDGAEMRERREMTPEELDGWLRAESAADDAEAERRLALLFDALVEPAPRPGFTARVLASIRAEEAAVRLARRRRFRHLATAAVLLSAAAFAGLLLAGPGGLGAIPALGARCLMAAGAIGRGVAWFWTLFATAFVPVAEALFRPWIFGVAAALALSSILMLSSLVRCLEREKGVVHALLPH
jgi:hypothetical protein